MESLISIFEQYVKTGGITMIPLVLCCLWMWLIIFYQLPFWQKKPYLEIAGIKKAFCHLKTGCRCHDKALLYFLQCRAGGKRIRQITTIKVLAAIAPF